MLWAAAAIVLLLDQLTKSMVVHSFMPNESRLAIPHLLAWTYVQNQRGAFGLFGDKPWLLIAMAIVVLGMFWFAFRDAAAQSLAVRIAFGAILGGAIGNVVDRLHYHYVVDFIDLRWWPVFNVADSCITLGVVALIIVTAFGSRTAPAASSQPPRMKSDTSAGLEEYTRSLEDERALARLRGRPPGETHEFDLEH